MLALRRNAVQSAERLPASIGRSTRRYASGHGDHGHHSAPKTESLGTQFFVAIALVPISVGIYTISRPNEDGTFKGFTNLINTYSQYKDEWVARNTLHTEMIEQAAFDRNLYQSSQGSKYVNLKFPEIFNTGSPYNVVAGQGPRDMDQLVAHYEKLNKENEENKLKRMAAKAEKEA